MIANGPRTCNQCATVFEFDAGRMVEARWSDAPCLGCERWNEYLGGIKYRAVKATDPDFGDPVDLTSLLAIEQALRAGTERARAKVLPMPARVVDWAKRAAGDVE